MKLRIHIAGPVLQFCLTGIVCLCAYPHSGQDVEQQLRREHPEISGIVSSDLFGTPSFLQLGSSIRAQEVQEHIQKYFELQSDDLLFSGKEIQYENNLSVLKFQRHYRDIPIEHSWYSVLIKNGSVLSIHAEHYVLNDIRISPSITESEALESALIDLGGELYAWEATHDLLWRQSQLPTAIRTRLEKIADDEFPRGKLVIVRDFTRKDVTFDLAFRFEIECVQPFFKDIVYVHAHDGHIMLRDPVIKHGFGDTRYAGTRTFPTSQYNVIGADTFQLRGIDPVSGILCETRSVNGMGGLPLSIAAIYALSSPILDGDQGDPCPTDGAWTIAETGDDVWNQNEHWRARFATAPLPDVSCCVIYGPHPSACNEIQNDDIALDAQWGASTVARYWLSRHGWESFDDAGSDIISFVHYGDAYANAFWNGTYMTYGDGNAQKPVPDANGDFGPFTSLDICAHEIGHAVCTYTSNLVYQKESGALNESLSDIWAAAIENFALDSIDPTLPYDPFGIGEQIDDRDNGLPPGDPAAQAIRWMDDPKAGANPDTYNGTYYYPTEGALCPAPVLATDYCGVHLNSGVINKWFYLLVSGSGQPLSPGSGFNGMKAPQDDEINDLGNTYEVAGIGFEKAEKITFLGETLLSPNASFFDMRLASIQAARALYGVCSDEETQTTNAWYAVGVGDPFMPCTPRIVFGEFNPQIVGERSDDTGCDASTHVQLDLHAFMASGTIQFDTWGSASVHLDYALDSMQLSFNGSEIKTLGIEIYDDKIVEGQDTLFIGFDNGVFGDTTFLLITDDDVIPAFAGKTFVLSETFDADTLPAGWQNHAVNVESGNEWAFNGSGLASGKAYVTFGASTLPAYNLAAFSHNRLVSPMIDARGRSNVTVTFDWAAGGEGDMVDPNVFFDFGSFQISHDGREWTNIQNFIGIAGGSVIDSGTYTQVHPELDNRTFFIGFQWYNDALLGSGFSFTIDNITVTTTDLEVESDVGDKMEAGVPIHETVAFISENDDQFLGIIMDAQDDLGCVQLRLVENDSLMDIVDAYCDRRSAKVFEVMSNNTTDSFQLTLLFRSHEVDAWETPEKLNILAVMNSDIDDLSNGFVIIPSEKVITEAFEGVQSYTFMTTGAPMTYALTDRAAHPVVRWVSNIADHDALSLRERIDAACPMDTIKFEPELAYETIQLTGSEISLNKDLVINGLGMGSTTIAGAEAARVFYVIAGVTVFLQDMTLCCGSAMGNGDIILNEGHIVARQVEMRKD